MAAVALALCSAVLFGGMSIAIAVAMQRNRDAEMGALVSGLVGISVCGLIALASWDWGGKLWPFLLAGLLAPGGSQILYVRAVRESGPARTSVVVGAAPLVAVTLALVALDEPVRAPLVAGAVLIVVGGLALAGERIRPEGFRAIGLALAFGATGFFATRDVVVRWLADDTEVPPQLAATTTLLSGSTFMVAYLLTTRGPKLLSQLRSAFRPYAFAGLLWGLSYASLFEAFYRGRVSVVSPLVATESLVGVTLAALLLRRTELVGRHLWAGAALIVAGGALIGAFR